MLVQVKSDYLEHYGEKVNQETAVQLACLEIRCVIKSLTLDSVYAVITRTVNNPTAIFRTDTNVRISVRVRIRII